MEDILVSALVTTVLENLNSIAQQATGLAWGLGDELKRLESTLSTVQLVLQDAEKKQRKSEALQNWLMKLRNAAFDAENILDLITIEGSRREKGTIASFFSQGNQFLSCYKIAREVRILRERLDAIAEERKMFHLTEGVSDNSVGGAVESRETSSRVNEHEIIGRKEEKEMIIETLLGTMVDNKLSVYAIWGMGGLGKTTLAQLVHNDERTKRHFDLRIWICVSNDFSIKRVLKAIIEFVDLCECNISELDALDHKLQDKLRGKRFLLVLDDVWNESIMLWEGLKGVLSCGSQGSVLMVTTRIEKVAKMMADSIPIHHLGYLSKADSLSLFRQRAFATGQKDEESLMKIGKAIVAKCGGVPLAIKALGSLMRNKSSEREWLAIMQSEIWFLPEDGNGILPALRLSYDNLPPYMRQCFAYCCIFRKDYRMKEDQLIQLWMANGFLPSEGQPDLHLTGHLIFQELVCRSFFQDVDVDVDLNERTCTMHDLVHDLAQSVMKHETYIMENDKALKIPKMLRHLSTDLRENRKIPVVKLPLTESNSLHSLVTCIPYEEEDLCSFLSKQQYLRVLDLQQDYMMGWTRPSMKLLNLICKLQHLRYLAMSCYRYERLPELLTNLYFLQTLKLTNTYSLLEMPKGLKLMKNLWFLDIKSHNSLLCTPPDMGELTCLQELSIFIVGRDSSTQIHQLKELNLGGELSIRKLENVRNYEDATSANLMGKMNLTSLSLSWSSFRGESFEEVLEGLQPHHNLRKLFINSYGGLRFPNWMSVLSYKNLTEISLERCYICEQLPLLGKLSSLTHLKLCELESIKCLGAGWHGNGETSFPALTNLTIDGMPNLEEWTLPDSGKSFPCLQSLKIRACPKLNGLPSLPALRDLKIEKSSVALLRSMVSLTSLPINRLNYFDELGVLPEELLQSQQATLEFLIISGMPNIKTLSNVLDNLSKLRHLTLVYCSNLESLSKGLKHLQTLEVLMIEGCDSLTSFPATILQDLSSLRTLRIAACKRLNPLLGPLQRESALETLWISGCPEFQCLPESMQQFTSLRELKIISCDPQLEKRCEKWKGQDWPKISHIPRIIIDGNIIQDCVL